MIVCPIIHRILYRRCSHHFIVTQSYESGATLLRNVRTVTETRGSIEQLQNIVISHSYNQYINIGHLVSVDTLSCTVPPPYLHHPNAVQMRG